ncbi:hypothetical protein D3C72_2149480 [compost metagenome]
MWVSSMLSNRHRSAWRLARSRLVRLCSTITSRAFSSAPPAAFMQRPIQRMKALPAMIRPNSSSDSSCDCAAKWAEATIGARGDRVVGRSAIVHSIGAGN